MISINISVSGTLNYCENSLNVLQLCSLLFIKLELNIKSYSIIRRGYKDFPILIRKNVLPIIAKSISIPISITEPSNFPFLCFS